MVEGFGEKRLGLADFFKNWGFSLGLHNTNSISDPPLPAESFQPLTVLLFPQDELAGTARYFWQSVAVGLVLPLSKDEIANGQQPLPWLFLLL